MNVSLRFANAQHITQVIARVIACSMLLVLPSCHIPKLNHAEPGPGLPATFSGASSSKNSAELGIEEFYNDPTLANLIHQALAGNRELRILDQEVQIASNEVLARQGAYLPFVTVGGSASALRSSLYTFEGSVEHQLDILPNQPFPDPLPNYMLGLNFLWQLDIWRAMRNARDAATQRYIAVSEKRNYFVTRLIAEVAENYYTLMALDNRLQVLDKIIELQEDVLGKAKARMKAARSTALPVQRFQADVRKNQSEKLIIKQEIVVAENRINFLVNRFPGPVERTSAGFLDLNINTLSVGVPSQLLQNRPDIRQAERELVAAGLDVKVARALFFPALSIMAGVGYEAFNPRYLFNSEALAANAAGNLIAPLINKKAIQAEYLSANARQLQAVYNYQRVILDAFTQVVNRISTVENYRKSIEFKRQQLTSLDEAVKSATDLFQFARIEYIEVLFVLRDLLDARTVLIETKKEQLTAIVKAYQALGGGDMSALSARARMQQCNTTSPTPRNLPAMLPAVDPPLSKPAPASGKEEVLSVPPKASPEQILPPLVGPVGAGPVPATGN